MQKTGRRELVAGITRSFLFNTQKKLRWTRVIKNNKYNQQRAWLLHTITDEIFLAPKIRWEEEGSPYLTPSGQHHNEDWLKEDSSCRGMQIYFQTQPHLLYLHPARGSQGLMQTKTIQLYNRTDSHCPSGNKGIRPLTVWSQSLSALPVFRWGC